MTGKRPAFPHIGWDPTPGNVEDTRALAKKLGGLASELGTAVRDLERIECGAWKGKAALAFTEYIGEDVTPLIRKSHESFDKASRALHRWARELHEFQEEANRLEKRAGEKLEARSEAKLGTKEMGKASGEVTTVIADVHDLEDRYSKAAGAISKELDKAGDIAPDEPGFWDKLGKSLTDAWDSAGDWIHDHADVIKLVGDVLSDLSGVLGMIAIITAPFEPIGAIFATAAVATSGLALATHLVAKAAGADVSWVSVGFDALGSLPGIGAFSKGVKVADGGVATARAAQLGKGFKGVTTLGRNIVGVGDNVAGAVSRTVRGRKIGLGGLKAGGHISTEGGLMNRMSLVAEQTVRNGQWIGTRGIPGLKNIDSMSNWGRGIDAAIKIAPKAFSIPDHIGEMTNPGDRLQQSAAAH
ncbi:enoyl-CoA hydratase/isomerase family protein [Streptomyces sp. NPDC005562]|uniref:enoyl-CoA hydratase/isomerase family protein n=1 Tax=Streptomyces sp. NPDC005562 TaxID=3154890 RepID=UPI0033B201D0